MIIIPTHKGESTLTQSKSITKLGQSNC